MSKTRMKAPRDKGRLHSQLHGQDPLHARPSTEVRFLIAKQLVTIYCDLRMCSHCRPLDVYQVRYKAPKLDRLAPTISPPSAICETNHHESSQGCERRIGPCKLQRSSITSTTRLMSYRRLKLRQGDHSSQSWVVRVQIVCFIVNLSLCMRRKRRSGWNWK